MIQKVAFAASMDDTRPVLTGVLMSMDGNTVSMVGTDGFRLAIYKAILPEPFAKKQLIIPASALKEVVRILNATKTARIIFVLPPNGSQVVFRCDNVQIVSQMIDGKFPDYQAILPKSHKTRAVLDAGDLLKACKQASIIAREGSNVVRFHFQPGADQTGKVKLLAESDETGASEIELDAMIEGKELEIAFNVKFLQDGLEAITTKKVTIEANAHNTPATIWPIGDEASSLGEKEDYLYILMPMHIDER
jgi:DNA polymerase-3 subunit beta